MSVKESDWFFGLASALGAYRSHRADEYASFAVRRLHKLGVPKEWDDWSDGGGVEERQTLGDVAATHRPCRRNTEYSTALQAYFEVDPAAKKTLSIRQF